MQGPSKRRRQIDCAEVRIVPGSHAEHPDHAYTCRHKISGRQGRIVIGIGADINDRNDGLGICRVIGRDQVITIGCQGLENSTSQMAADLRGLLWVAAER